MHGRIGDCRSADLDVLWFDPAHARAEEDARFEQTQQRRAPGYDWSVRNQARMHLRDGDAAYVSVEGAMCAWPETEIETATAVAARRTGKPCEILAPFGLEDLDAMVVRPTSRAPEKLAAFRARLERKGWQDRRRRGCIVA